MKSFVSYTNCVGTALWQHFLRDVLPEYTLYEMTNYEMIRDKSPIPVDVVRNADVFLYQPIDERNGIYHTTTEKGILQYLKPECVRICLPAVGADMYPIYKDFDGVRGPVIDRNVPLFIHLANYDAHAFFFQLRERFDRGIQHMKRREGMCNVKAADFILQHYQKHRMFTTQNHPSGMLLAHLANQILRILGVDKQYDLFGYDSLLVGDEPAYFESEYMKRELGLQYPIQDNHEFYRKLLIHAYKHPELARPTKTMLLKD